MSHCPERVARKTCAAGQTMDIGLSHRNGTSGVQNPSSGAVRPPACSHHSRTTVPVRRGGSTSRVGKATRFTSLGSTHVGPTHELTKLLCPLEGGLRADRSEVLKAGVGVAVTIRHCVLGRGATSPNANLPKRKFDSRVGEAECAGGSIHFRLLVEFHHGSNCVRAFPLLRSTSSLCCCCGAGTGTEQELRRKPGLREAQPLPGLSGRRCHQSWCC